MSAPEKTKILYATDVRETDTFNGGDSAVEVVGLVNHEHVVDYLRDRLRDREDETRAIGRLVGAFKGQSVLAAVFRMVEEVEHYRELRREAPILDSPAHVCEGLCHAHGAFGPEGDCYVCDARQERERAEAVEDKLVLLGVHHFCGGPVDLEQLTRWLEIDSGHIEQALDRLEDEDKVHPVVTGADRPRWKLGE